MRVQGAAKAGPEGGFTLIELLFTVGLAGITVVSGLAWSQQSLDEVRTALAARYLEGRIMDARMQAVSRSARVALRFEPADGDYRIAVYVDGNGNGVRTADIGAGLDALLSPPRPLADSYSGVRFGILPGAPEVDASTPAADLDGVRVGASGILTLGPDGSSSSGTLYVRGRSVQYAVRVLGATARVRLLRYDPASRRWISR